MSMCGGFPEKVGHQPSQLANLSTCIRNLHNLAAQTCLCRSPKWCHPSCGYLAPHVVSISSTFLASPFLETQMSTQVVDLSDLAYLAQDEDPWFLNWKVLILWSVEGFFNWAEKEQCTANLNYVNNDASGTSMYLDFGADRIYSEKNPYVKTCQHMSATPLYPPMHPKTFFTP